MTAVVRYCSKCGHEYHEHTEYCSKCGAFLTDRHEVEIPDPPEGGPSASTEPHNGATKECPFCEAEIGAQAKRCRFCSEWISRSCEGCGTGLRGEWAARGLCAECQAQRNVPVTQQSTSVVVDRKSRGISILLALLFGGLGLHRFYLGKLGSGVVYLVLCWTLIPSIIALFEGINYAIMGEAEFQRRYSN